MAAVLAAAGLLWLALVTLGLIGVNVRISIVRRDLLVATGRLRAPGADSSPDGTGLAAGTVLLLVSETCTTCNDAIEALRDAVADGGLAGRQVYVMSPDPGDPRVTPPLALLADDELYRRLYDKKTPELIEIGADGEPTHRFPVPAAAELRRQIRRLDAPSSLPA